ncbi:hypothetical protein BB561_003118 [Smittium simulii]|uniref:UDP-galactose transporter homolog 1 n=1 Tax=Smittium simulii TaxID=133385 RepID=A0A2T9YMT5_9FUNG|nr:hypothetical protein BB561_003118 [Smittium simulii]
MLRLLINIAGVYACFLTWGLTQERVTSTVYSSGQKFKFFLVLNMVQAFIASLVGYIYSIIILKDKPLVLTKERTISFVKIAVLCSIGSPFGYMALKHIDYLTMTLAKSSKLIPLMVMHKLLYRKTYPFYKYIIVAMITAGVFFFMVFKPGKNKQADVTKPGANKMLGIFFVFINLVVDGSLNSSQEELIKSDKKVNGRNMMTIMNFFTGLVLLMWLLNPWNPELYNAYSFLVLNPAAIWDILVFGFCGAIGQCFIFSMLANYGSLVLVTVTVTRKLFTMLLSVVLYNHVLSTGQWLSIALVFAAIVLETVIKYQQKNSSSKHPKPELLQNSLIDEKKDL